MPANSTKQEKENAVDDMINKLSLEKVKDSIIGSATRRGISGGEKKRCAIGKELLSSPTILFLDEPTSGLDSFQAISVIQALQKMALTGKIVVSVIHQPSSAIFKLFDSLLLLADGKVVYSGTHCIPYSGRFFHSTTMDYTVLYIDYGLYKHRPSKLRN